MTDKPEVIDYHWYVEPRGGPEPESGSAFVVRFPDNSVRMAFAYDWETTDFSRASFIQSGKEHGVLKLAPSMLPLERRMLTPDISAAINAYYHLAQPWPESRIADRPYVVKTTNYIDPQHKEAGTCAKIFEVRDDVRLGTDKYIADCQGVGIDLHSLRRVSKEDENYLHFMSLDDIKTNSKTPHPQSRQAVYYYEKGIYNFGKPHPHARPVVFSHQDKASEAKVTREYLTRNWFGVMERVCLPINKATKQAAYEVCAHNNVARALRVYDVMRKKRPLKREGHPIVIARGSYIYEYSSQGDNKIDGYLYRLLYENSTVRDVALFINSHDANDYSLIKFLAPSKDRTVGTCLHAGLLSNMNALPVTHEPVPEYLPDLLREFDAAPSFENAFEASPVEHVTYFYRYEKPDPRKMEGIIYKYMLPEGKEVALACCGRFDNNGQKHIDVHFTKTGPYLFKRPAWERELDSTIFLPAKVPDSIASFMRTYHKYFAKLEAVQIKNVRQWAKNPEKSGTLFL